MFEELVEKYKTKGTSHLRRQHPDFYLYLVENTAFLAADVSATQRLWHFWNNKFSIPLCIKCDHPVAWDIVKQTYRTYCCRTCSSASLLVQNQQTNESIRPPRPKCAVDQCSNLTSWINQKWSATCSTKCRALFNSLLRIPHDELQLVISQIPSEYDYRRFVTEHRGAFNTIQDLTQSLPVSYQIRERIEWLLGERITKSESISEQIKLMGVTGAGSVREARAKARGNNNCSVCGGVRKYDPVLNRYPKFCTTACEDVNERRIANRKLVKALTRLIGSKEKRIPHNKNTDPVLNDKDWLIEHHHNLQWTKQQIAHHLGVDKETITNRFALFGIKSVRHAGNAAERALTELIREIIGPNVEVIVNVRNIIAPLELDIYIPEYKIAIEYCGLYWHSDAHDRIDRNYHSRKYKLCKELDIRLITIFEDEWLHKRAVVTDKLRSIFHKSIKDRIYARNTTVAAITSSQRGAFLNVNHIQGDGKGQVSLALKHGQDVVAVMVFQHHQNDVWVLSRYATSHHVVGGFTKLLKYFQHNHRWTKIVSFADLRWSEGSVYVKSGFTPTILKPDYSYINQSNITRVHKFNYRRKMLGKLLSNFDPLLSETENTRNHNVFKIWDCGKIRYELINA